MCADLHQCGIKQPGGIGDLVVLPTTADAF
jgi:hypothetical protein